jgi:hypothetical protein
VGLKPRPGYVTASGRGFAHRKKGLISHGATIYPYCEIGGTVVRGSGWSNPAFARCIDSTLSLAAHCNLNTVRAVDFLEGISDPYNMTVWRNIDHLFFQAAAHNMYVVLDLSTYRNMLRSRGAMPYDAGRWSGFVRFVGRRYAARENLLYYAIAGEPEAPNGEDPLRPSAAQLTSFYRETGDRLRAADANHLISAGGLLYLDWSSGIDWRAILGLPNISLASVHVYSGGDRSMVPMVASWARVNNRAFVVEEFGFEQEMGDRTRADAFRNAYEHSRAVGAAGVIFWNLGAEIGSWSHDVGPQTPITWQTVRDNAPGRCRGMSPSVISMADMYQKEGIHELPRGV